MTSRYLDLGCGASPRNPYHRDEVHTGDLAMPEGVEAALFRRANLSLEPIPYPNSTFDSISAFDFFEHIPRILATPDGKATAITKSNTRASVSKAWSAMARHWID